MIHDKIENLLFWADRIPSLHRALLESKALTEKEFLIGKTIIDGEDIYASSSAYTTEPREVRRFENHRRYADIQMLIEGEEYIDVCFPNSPLPEHTYSAESDIEFLDLSEKYTTVTLKAGEFLLLFPGEWHRPCVSVGKEQCECQKIVTKIKM
ncbi:MAG: YhcH/YjgK/YiaL family protein [Clostridia bacterium]|nr:YhcH/YjgK/YiaL family protein [Clostridia bacterium]